MKIKNTIIALLFCLSANVTFSQKEVCNLIDDFAQQIEKADTFEKVRLALEMQAEINFELGNYIEKVQAEVNDALANKLSDKPNNGNNGNGNNGNGNGGIDPRSISNNNGTGTTTVSDKQKTVIELQGLSANQINSGYNLTTSKNGRRPLVVIAEALDIDPKRPGTNRNKKKADLIEEIIKSVN